MLGNKSKKFKKRKMQEFASTYSLKTAFVKGDIFTKLSAVVMGLGNIVRGQVVKGLLFLAVQAAYIIYMIKVGIGC